jgi:PRC-barrel domain
MFEHPERRVSADTQFIEGTPVLDAAGERIGTIRERIAQETGSEYLNVRHGRVFGKEMLIPRAAVVRYDGEGIHLNLTKEEMREQPDAVQPGVQAAPEEAMLPPNPPDSVSMVDRVPAEVGVISMSPLNPWNPLDETPAQGPSAPASVQTQTYPAPGESVRPGEQEAPANTQMDTSLDLSHPGTTMRTALGQVEQRAGDAIDQLKNQAGDTVAQLKNQAGDTVEKVKTQANDQLDTQMTQAGLSLATVADAVETLSDQLRRGNQALLADYADRAGGQVDQLATYLRQSDPNKVLHDVEDFAKREPVLFLAGAFAIGLLGTRFLKSSSSQVGNQTKQ